jgi:glycosyltransferase involved in cell wall biosynthesis
VKDECELIERTIAHLRAIGVDHLVVCDVDSTDGTAEILDRYASDTFQIVKVSNDELADDTTWDRKNKQALEQVDADWFVFLDADEFLLPKSGSLKRDLDQIHQDILQVPRFNVPLGPAGPMLPEELLPDRYAEAQLIVKSFPNIFQHLIDNAETPWIRAVPMPKVVARRECFGHWADGMHDVIPREGKNFRRAIPDSLVIAHVPLSSKARFTRKIQNIRECLGADEIRKFITAEEPSRAWHWKRWVHLADKGEVDREFERSIFSFDHVDELYRDGYVRSVAEIFAEGASTFARR